MDGIHDLGGMDGFGPVVVEMDEPAFHARWESTARALVYVVGAAASVSTAEFRHAIERMDPGHYLTSSYYEHWLTAAATLAVEHGLVTREELEARTGAPFPLARPARAGAAAALGAASPSRAEADPALAVGSRVRVIDRHPPGHTRCPGYTRGHTGTIVRAGPAAPVPDLEAHGGGRVVEPTWTVAFDAADLWRDGQSGVSVRVDLWDRYLEVAP